MGQDLPPGATLVSGVLVWNWGLVKRISCIALAVALGACGESVTPPEPPVVKSWAEARSMESVSDDTWPGDVILYDSGGAIVAWQTNLGYELSEIRISRYDDTAGWSESSTISDVPSWSYQPSLDSDSPETAVAVWLAVKPGPASSQQVYAATYSAVDGWSPENLLSLSGESSQSPSVAGLGDGRAIVAWEQVEPLGYSEAYQARFQPGVGWAASAPIEDVDMSISSPRVVGDPAGNSTVFWFKDDFPNEDKLVAATHEPATGWGSVSALGALDFPIVYFAVTSDYAGGATVAYAQNNGLYIDAFAVDYLAAAGWQTPLSIGGVDPGPRGMAVANSRNGDSFIVWPKRDGPYFNDPYDILVSRRVSGGDWEAPVAIDDRDGLASSVALAANNQGGVVAVWLQHDGETESVFAAEFDPTSGWSDPQLLEESNGTSSRWHEAHAPRLAMNSKGEAMAVWLQYDGTAYSVFAALYR